MPKLKPKNKLKNEVFRERTLEIVSRSVKIIIYLRVYKGIHKLQLLLKLNNFKFKTLTVRVVIQTEL